MTTQWYSAHIFYHDHDKSPLLLDAVRPVLERLSGRVAAAYPVRHWRQGPHIRLRVRAAPDVWDEVARPAIDEIVGAYLRVHPSTTQLDPDALLPEHRYLAEQEQERGPLMPWYPDNTIHYLPFDARLHAVNGHELAAELLADFYTDSTRLLLDMLEAVRQKRETLGLLAFTLMITTAHAVGGAPRNAGSFRSHGEGFIAACANPEVVRTEFDARYRTHRDELAQRVRDVVAALDTGATALPFVHEWAELITRHVQHAAPIVELGAMPTISREEALRNPRLSEYYRLAWSSDEYIRRGLHNPEFLRYRVVLNYTYLQLTRLGVPPRERFLLCHLAANTIEDLYSVSAFRFIREFARKHPRPSEDR